MAATNTFWLKAFIRVYTLCVGHIGCTIILSTPSTLDFFLLLTILEALDFEEHFCSLSVTF